MIYSYKYVYMKISYKGQNRINILVNLGIN